MRRSRQGSLSVLLFALASIAAIVAVSFALGYILGKLLL